MKSMHFTVESPYVVFDAEPDTAAELIRKTKKWEEAFDPGRPPQLFSLLSLAPPYLFGTAFSGPQISSESIF